MPTSTTNTYEISLRLLENTPFAVAVSSDNRCQVKPPVLMRGVPSILRIKLFKAGGLVTAAELSALYTGFRLVIANDFDDTTAPLLVSDENGATIDAQNDCIFLPISEMNTETLEDLIGTRERLDLGAELQLFKPTLQDEPIEAWQFPIGVQNRRDLTGTATPAPGSINYYNKDETDDLLDDKIDTDEKGAANGVAELDENGLIPRGELPKGGNNSGQLGAVFTVASVGLSIESNGRIGVVQASNQRIDRKNEIGERQVVTPGNLDYAVRSVSPNVTTIPAATSAYSLLDATATTNGHSWHYVHEPTSAPTYTLPAVTNATVVHAIDLKVKFSANVLTYSFLDSAGNAVTPLAQPDIAAGTVVDFLCEYDPLSSQWAVMPLVLAEGGAS